MREAGLGLKAATITPEGADDVGSPNRLIREGIDGKVIVRTGPADPGRLPDRRHPPPDLGLPDGGRRRLRRRAVARGRRTARRSPSGPSGSAAPSAARSPSTRSATAEQIEGRVYGGPKWTVSPVYEGMLKEEMDAAAERHPEVPYEPVLIDATSPGSSAGPPIAPLVIPTLNRDGDLLSDLVMPMFGSIAGAESVLLGARRRAASRRSRWPRPRTAPPRRSRARTSPTRWR